MAIQGILRTCHGYYNQIPADSLQKMALSAIGSFTATYLFSKEIPGQPYNVALPLAAGGVAFLASLIYSLSTPIFNKIFGNKKIVFYQELVKQAITVTLTSAAVEYFLTSKVNLFALRIIGNISINLLKSGADIIPKIADDWFNCDDFAESFRKNLTDVEEGSGSIFLNFGFSLA